jgi:DNA replication protein DnaC
MAQIPPRYFDRGFELYSVHHPSQQEALTRSIDFVDGFPDVERGLVLVGDCGVGKTHLAVAILKSLVVERGVNGRFVDEAELLRRLQYSYGPDSPDTEREVMMPLMEADLLIWDDLGTGRPTDWVRETTRMVINYRYTNRKHTILTTNWHLSTGSKKGERLSRGGEQSLEERIGTRLYSRIMEMCEVVQISGPDARSEIHKAGMDFRPRGVKKRAEIKIPTSMLECPQCHARQVKILDQSDLKAGGLYLELFCLCESCSEHFLARFHPKTARLEYPSP